MTGNTEDTEDTEDDVTDVTDVASAPLQHSPGVWGNVPARNPDFAGREELLQRLRAQMATDARFAALPQVLHGPARAGKTQLAVEYAYRYEADYDLVWWIPARRPDLVRSSIAMLAPHLGIAGDTVVDAVIESLGRHPPPFRWLLVFDDAGHPEKVAPFLPRPSDAGHVLVTSRNPDWEPLTNIIEVDARSQPGDIVPWNRPGTNNGMSGSRGSARLFVSYSHRDERSRERLWVCLATLRRQGLIDWWDDQRIPPGAEWEPEIVARLDEADIVILLVSPDFLDSDYIYSQEIGRALRRHYEGRARVIPVIARPSDWEHSPIGTLQALPRQGRAISAWANRDRAWDDVARGIRQAISTYFRR